MTRIILRALNGPILIFLVIIAIALQSSLFSSWPLFYLQPDIVLLVTIWCALRRGFEEGGIITLIIANLTEIHSSAPQGLYLINYMVVYLLVRASSRFIVIPSLFSYAMITLTSSMIWKLTGLVILYLLGSSINQWRHHFSFLFLSAASAGTLSLFVYRWLDRFDWITYKNSKTDHISDDEYQISNEGFF